MENVNLFITRHCPTKEPIYLTFNGDRGKERKHYNSPVIYLLIHNYTIVYVGYTKSLPIRLTAHRSSKKVFDRICIIPFCKDGAAQRMEQTAIEYFLPKYNKQYKPVSVIYNRKKAAIFTKETASIYIKNLNKIAENVAK